MPHVPSSSIVNVADLLTLSIFGLLICKMGRITIPLQCGCCEIKCMSIQALSTELGPKQTRNQPYIKFKCDCMLWLKTMDLLERIPHPIFLIDFTTISQKQEWNSQLSDGSGARSWLKSFLRTNKIDQKKIQKVCVCVRMRVGDYATRARMSLGLPCPWSISINQA